MAIGLFISEQYLKDNTTIDENVDMQILLPTIWQSQEQHIQAIIGGALYKDLLSKIAPTDTLSGDDLTLVDDFIAPALLWWVMYEADITMLYKYRNKNVSKKNSENATPVDFKEHRYLREYHKDKAEWWSQRLVNYLCNNSQLFPQYNNSQNEELRPKSDAYESNLFLGGNIVKNVCKDCE